jgi:hypothetical protein
MVESTEKAHDVIGPWIQVWVMGVVERSGADRDTICCRKLSFELLKYLIAEEFAEMFAVGATDAELGTVAEFQRATAIG